MQNASYAWLFQDLFGICLCVLFLSVIKLSSLRVASLLLCMAFCYDIFFVFISPHLFGERDGAVATGKAPTKDADYCEKYPDDKDCQSQSLPMLLLLPRFDGLSGYTMLGLGDIVLPGLLVAFAARCDACALQRRCFPLMVCGYAVGLAMANVAVAYFAQGQPALLYLVPCTLGPFLHAAQRDGTFADALAGAALAARSDAGPRDARCGNAVPGVDFPTTRRRRLSDRPGHRPRPHGAVPRRPRAESRRTPLAPANLSGGGRGGGASSAQQGGARHGSHADPPLGLVEGRQETPRRRRLLLHHEGSGPQCRSPSSRGSRRARRTPPTRPPPPGLDSPRALCAARNNSVAMSISTQVRDVADPLLPLRRVEGVQLVVVAS